VQSAFRVGESHRVEPSLNSVTGPAGTVRLEPKVMQVLVCLAAHAGDVVAKEHLIRTVWPDTFVTDDVLTRSISELRRVFGDDAKEPRFIQTILKSGYRLIAQVSPDDTEQRVVTLGQTARIGTAEKGDGGVVALFPTGRASAHVQSRWRARTLGLWAIGLWSSFL
jgi:DNA-binding winged helix-turn-helix (wHTH) protein